MSQFACPLCGKNSSIRKYDPDELDLDLKVVTYGSTGRGGIFIADKSSTLGQGDPIEQALARRTVKLIRMFIDSGTLNREQVAAELGLNKIKIDTLNPSRDARTLNLILSVEERYELEQLRKLSVEDREMRTTLLAISRLCKSELRLGEDLELTLQVYDTDKHDFQLMGFFESMNKAKRNEVLRRISTEEPSIQFLFEEIANQPEKKDAFQQALETDIDWKPGGQP